MDCVPAPQDITRMASAASTSSLFPLSSTFVPRTWQPVFATNVPVTFLPISSRDCFISANASGLPVPQSDAHSLHPIRKTLWTPSSMLITSCFSFDFEIIICFPLASVIYFLISSSISCLVDRLGAEYPPHCRRNRARTRLLHPRMDMQRCSQSITTIAPFGPRLSIIRSASCAVSLSCTCGLLASISSAAASLLSPTILPSDGT